MTITWRDVRIWGTARRRGQAPAVDETSSGGGEVVRHRAEHRTGRCGASGWRMRLGCTDAICPLCGQPVQARPEALGGTAVRVIQEHVA